MTKSFATLLNFEEQVNSFIRCTGHTCYQLAKECLADSQMPSLLLLQLQGPWHQQVCTWRHLGWEWVWADCQPIARVFNHFLIPSPCSLLRALYLPPSAFPWQIIKLGSMMVNTAQFKGWPKDPCFLLFFPSLSVCLSFCLSPSHTYTHNLSR